MFLYSRKRRGGIQLEGEEAKGEEKQDDDYSKKLAQQVKQVRHIIWSMKNVDRSAVGCTFEYMIVYQNIWISDS